VVVEEAQEAPNAVLSTFLINDTAAVVLFGFEAFHFFISTAYVQKHNLPISLLMRHMVVSSPRGDVPTRQICLKENLKVKG
jgi:hypothetical protein